MFGKIYQKVFLKSHKYNLLRPASDTSPQNYVFTDVGAGLASIIASPILYILSIVLMTGIQTIDPIIPSIFLTPFILLTLIAVMSSFFLGVIGCTMAVVGLFRASLHGLNSAISRCKRHCWPF